MMPMEILIGESSPAHEGVSKATMYRRRLGGGIATPMYIDVKRGKEYPQSLKRNESLIGYVLDHSIPRTTRSSRSSPPRA